MRWEDRTGNSYSEIAGSPSNGIWTGTAWQSNQGTGLHQYVQMQAIGSWTTGYSPGKVRVTFEDAVTIEYFLLGVSADYLWITPSATSPDTGDLTAGSRIDFFSFFAVDTPTQQFRITKIEFGFAETEEEEDEMSEALIRAQIKATLESATGIGAVHDYPRTPRSLADFFELMRSAGTVNGIAFYRQSFANSHKTLGTQTLGGTVRTQKERAHRYVFAGIYAVDDAGASMNTLQGLLEDIADKFDVNLTLNGTAESHDLFQLDAVYYSDPGEYGDNIYHLFEASLTVRERRT